MNFCCFSYPCFHRKKTLNMALVLYGAASLFLGMATAFGPVPRITWEHKEVHLVYFQEPETFNYSTLLLSEDKDVLYVGAREVIFALNALNISEKRQEVFWKVTEDKKTKCAEKGKSKQTECLNYVRVLQQLDDTLLYVCGTNAFQPVCDHLNLTSFKLMGRNDDGKGRCPFDPAQSYTSVMVDGDLYSGTSYNFLGSEPIISRNSLQNPLRTEYAIPWLNEPNFIFADVIRAGPDNHNEEDDKVYFFFTEVSVEYEFLGKLMIPRIARVCKGDQGGHRTLQKKWTSYLKARLLCSVPDKNLFFNIVNDVFILKPPNSKETVIYGVFSPQLNNVGLSAVCAYNISSVEDVFAKGKYMQSTTVEQSHTKWMRYNGEIPNPRPGACINKEAKSDNFKTTLSLPDKTLQFVKDHPLMDDSVTPIGDRPRLVKRDVKYTQIVVDQVRALNGTLYDVMFISTDQGALHKAISYENGMHIIEETQLYPNFEPIQTLLLSSKKGKQYLYTGSNAGVVQSPVAFCDKYSSCVDCVLARDPYCAWNPHESLCVDIFKESEAERDWIQNIGGDASSCADKVREHSLQHTFKHGSTAELKCSQKSNLAQVVWKFKDDVLKVESPKYRLLEKALLIFNLSESDSGIYQCLSEEKVKNKKFSQVLAKHILELKKIQHTTLSPSQPTTRTEASSPIAFPPTGTSSLPCLESDPPPSPISPQPDVWSSTDFATVMLLPPFLSDQIRHVNAHITFLLFCQATGPQDAHFVWKKNGQKLEACVNQQTLVLADGRLHLLSWVKDTVAQNSEYCCFVISKAGNKTSTSYITVEGGSYRDTWSRELANWRSAVSEHDKMMESWKKTWESCNRKDTV
ncbi:semaphorin-4D isoform X2 [Rhineura floridana]|uniref:semaphorin-4D isoform X2 n=1 Tax=Rhineura floridana TaxID=261503 RepID=UPI002AC82759|nr:semaphorin-4D isoform X2 [Rhineura floridana]